MRIEAYHDDCVTAADVLERARASRTFRRQEYTRPAFTPPPVVKAPPEPPPRKPVERPIVLPNFLALKYRPTCVTELEPGEPASWHPTVAHIIRSCASYYNVHVLDIKSTRRPAGIVIVRQVAMYLAKKLTPHSLPEIGRRFGGRDHTSVLHNVRKIERILPNDAALAGRIAEIESAIMARLAG